MKLFLSIFVVFALFSCGEDESKVEEIHSVSEENFLEKITKLDSVESKFIEDPIQIDSFVNDKPVCDCDDDYSFKNDRRYDLLIPSDNWKRFLADTSMSFSDSLVSNVKSVMIRYAQKGMPSLDKFSNLESLTLREVKVEPRDLSKLSKTLKVIYAEKSRFVGNYDFKDFKKLQYLVLKGSGFIQMTLNLLDFKSLREFETTVYLGKEFDLSGLNMDSLPCLEILSLSNWHTATGLPQNLENSNLKSLRYYGEGLSQEDKTRLKEFNKSR